MVKWWVRGVEGRAMCPKHTMVTQARERVATRCQLIRHGPPWRLPGGSLRVRSFFQFARVAPYKVIGGKSGMGGGGRTKERHQWNGCASASQQLFKPKVSRTSPIQLHRMSPRCFAQWEWGHAVSNHAVRQQCLSSAGPQHGKHLSGDKQGSCWHTTLSQNGVFLKMLWKGAAPVVENGLLLLTFDGFQI